MHCFDIDGRGRQCIRTAPPPSTTRYSIVGVLYRAYACYVPLRLFLPRLRTPYRKQPCRMQSAWSSQVTADLIVHGSTTGEVVSFSGVPSLLLVMGSLSGPLTTALLTLAVFAAGCAVLLAAALHADLSLLAPCLGVDGTGVDTVRSRRGVLLGFLVERVPAFGAVLSGHHFLCTRRCCERHFAALDGAK